MIRNRFRILKNDLPLLYLASRDKRTPAATKIITGMAVIYFFNPVDFVPDFIPLLGLVDDLFMVPLLISLAIKTIPGVVLTDAKIKLYQTRSRIKTWLLAFVIICICAVIAFYGYKYYRNYLDVY